VHVKSNVHLLRSAFGILLLVSCRRSGGIARERKRLYEISASRHVTAPSGAIEFLAALHHPAEDRRHPYRITSAGEIALRDHLDSLERVSTVGRLRLGLGGV